MICGSDTRLQAREREKRLDVNDMSMLRYTPLYVWGDTRRHYERLVHTKNSQNGEYISDRKTIELV